MTSRLDSLMEALKPPPKLTVAQWAERHRVLAQESSANPGQWNNAKTPYLVEIMEAFSDPGVSWIICMMASQLGKTETQLNILGFVVDLDPGPLLWLSPTVEDAEDFSRDRIQPMIDLSRTLREKVSPAKSRNGGNKILHKKFRGGYLRLVGANAPSKLASRPIRVVLADEVDRYASSAGKEGDPVMLAFRRTETFWNRKIILVSTPHIKGESRIESEWETSDQREFYVPCPHCGFSQTLKMERMRFPFVPPDELTPEDVSYECADCSRSIENADLPEMLARGRWVAKFPKREKRGYHLNTFYSPWARWFDTIREYLTVKDDPERLKTFVNTKLGLPFEQKGEVPEWERLYERRERLPLRVVPEGGLFVTAGVDVQHSRLECQVVAWGRNKENWSLDYRVFPGNVEEDDVWETLFEYLSEPLPHALGGKLPVVRVAIDTSDKTQRCYAMVRRLPSTLALAIKGSDSLVMPIGTGSPVDVYARNRRISNGVLLWRVGSSHLKAELYGWLRLARPLEGKPFPSGYCHFPEYGPEFFQSLTSEALVAETNRRTRRTKYFWKKIRDRNEALDTFVYARAAAAHFGLDGMSEERWKRLERDVRDGKEQKRPKKPKVITPKEGGSRERWCA